MPDSQLSWSKADTHCVWCGRQEVTYRDLVEGRVDDFDAGCMNTCAFYTDGEEAAEDTVLSLRATVEAQGKVIERLRKGYKPVYEVWVRNGTPEPMEPDEQVVLYGEVVNEEAEDGW